MTGARFAVVLSALAGIACSRSTSATTPAADASAAEAATPAATGSSASDEGPPLVESGRWLDEGPWWSKLNRHPPRNPKSARQELEALKRKGRAGALMDWDAERLKTLCAQLDAACPELDGGSVALGAQ